MKKTIKETIQWHPVEIKYPEHMKMVILQSNDGVLIGFWNKHDKRWVAGYSEFSYLNSDTHIYYWSYFPKGIDIYAGLV